MKLSHRITTFILLSFIWGSTVRIQRASGPILCTKSTVAVTLAGEQFSFCAPTAARYTVVEDSSSDQFVSYAAFNQLNGYAFVGIRSALPGHRPGIGMPVYSAGAVDVYREEIRKTNRAKSDQTILGAVNGLFWNAPVSGIQVQTKLPQSDTVIQLNWVEWDIEHNGRLWTVTLGWDAALSNATEWQNAASGFAIGDADKTTQDTALDLGAIPISRQNTSVPGLPIDVGTPPWWSGTCNDGNYYPTTGVSIGTHAFMLGASWHNVVACGPRPVDYMYEAPPGTWNFPADHLVNFFSGAWGEYEFECVELVMRFVYLEWGIAPFRGNANQIKDNIPSSATFYPNGNHNLMPGDIITENSSIYNYGGHAAIVTGVNLDSSGNGTLSIMEQNASSSGSRSLSVSGWSINPDAGANNQTVQGWIHAKSNTSEAPSKTATSALTATSTPTATITSTPRPPQPDTIGVYRPGAGTFYLRNSNSLGAANITATIQFASASDLPVTGDWNGDGIDTLGLYRTASGFFYLWDANANQSMTTPIYTLLLGNPGDAPFAGRWTTDMTHDGLGVYRNSNGILYEKKQLTSGYADFFAILGNPGDRGLAGDWDGNGLDSPGVFRPSALRFYLTNNSTPGGITYSDIDFVYGAPADTPVAGDWIGQGQAGIGMIRSSDGLFYLRNQLTSGNADNSFFFGIANDKPVAGKWIARSQPNSLDVIQSGEPPAGSTQPANGSID